MNKESFFNFIKDHLKENLSDEFKNGECILSKANKNNQVLTGITIQPSETNTNILSPLIYLDDYYTRFKEGVDLQEILDSISNIYETYSRKAITSSFNKDMILNYDLAKEHIYPKLISISGNEELLKDKIYREMEDLAVLYYIDLSNNLGADTGMPTVTITKSIMKEYGVTEEEINKQALINQKERGYELKNLFSLYCELMGIDIPVDPNADNNIAYVLRNNTGFEGASLIADKDILKEVTKKLGSDEIYILPSSIHEVIIVPAAAVINHEDLRAMVTEANVTAVIPTERLSDNIYHYDAKYNEFTVIDGDLEESLD